eukprot:jgi/Picsp_1/2908/NSC_01133-R1_caax prenyl protease 2-like
MKKRMLVSLVWVPLYSLIPTAWAIVHKDTAVLAETRYMASHEFSLDIGWLSGCDASKLLQTISVLGGLPSAFSMTDNAVAILLGAGSVLVIFIGPLTSLFLEPQARMLMMASLENKYVSLRNLLVAPLTEEICFRSGLISYLLMMGYSPGTCIWASPFVFGLSHVHHIVDMIRFRGFSIAQSVVAVSVQLGYTVMFGWFASYLFVQSGNVLAVVAAHSVCNLFGFPPFAQIRYYSCRNIVLLSYVIGVLLFPLFVVFALVPRRFGYEGGEDYLSNYIRYNRPLQYDHCLEDTLRINK